MDFGLNAKIFFLSCEGLSNRAIGRSVYVSEHCVRGRLVRLAQRAFCFHSSLCEGLKISEPLCYDGLQNFAGSQYDPNYINQAIGRDSLFIYDFNFASLNRAGRMSDWQKQRLAEIIDEQGRYNPTAVRIATRRLLDRLYIKRDPQSEFTLLSDEHFHYRKAVKQDLRHLKIDHITISSKATRNYQNILFAVNHADLMIRQKSGAFARETISFSKTPGAMCQKYALYMINKNYMSPQFTKKMVRRPEAHLASPAQTMGLCERVLSFSEIFVHRSVVPDLTKLNPEWRQFWRGKIPKEHRRSKEFSKPALAT